MSGGLYADRAQNQFCKICDENFQDNRRDAVCCLYHPDQFATIILAQFWDKKEKKYTSQTFNLKKGKTYKHANKWLNGLRLKQDEDIFDRNDYSQGQPNLFDNVLKDYLAAKRPKWSKMNAYNVQNTLEAAGAFWEKRNIKAFQKKDFREYLNSLKVSDHTKNKHLKVLKSFFRWAYNERTYKITELPQFPDDEFTFIAVKRLPVTPEIQQKIFDEIYKTTFSYNPRTWIAFKLISDCFQLRPKEVVAVRYQDIDFNLKVLTVKEGKTAKTVGERIVPLTRAVLDLIKALPPDLPGIPFFRHTNKGSGRYVGEAFSEKYLNRITGEACKALGIPKVPFYLLTVHSTLYRLSLEGWNPVELCMAANKDPRTFGKHYFGLPIEKTRAIYENQKTRSHSEVNLNPSGKVSSINKSTT